MIGRYFTVHAYFDQKLSQYSTGFQSKSDIEVFYVASGNADFTVIDNSGTPVTENLKAGDLILIDAESTHRISVEKDCHGLLLEIRVQIADSDSVPTVDSYAVICHCDSLIKVFGEKNYIFLNDFLFIKQTIIRLQSLLNSDRLRYLDHYFTQIIISELLLSINECYRKTYLENPYINRIIEYITREYQNGLSAARIAGAMNLNETYLQKLFKKETGVTLLRYITQYRIGQAISLMRTTKMKILDIALEVGFNNRQTFYNALKEYTGYSPKVFRKYLSSPSSYFVQEER
jgi:AraC-like DNA-binding protein